MSLEQFLQTIESRVSAVGRWLWADDPRVTLKADEKRTAEALQKHHASLKVGQQALREACSRLLDLERRIADLNTEVRASAGREHATAVQCAVELEEARAALAAERVRIEELQRTCETHQTELTRLEAHLAELQGQLNPGERVS